MSAAIVEPKFSVEQVLRLQQAVGQPQVTRIVAAVAIASSEQPPMPVIESVAPAQPTDQSTVDHPSSADSPDAPE